MERAYSFDCYSAIQRYLRDCWTLSKLTFENMGDDDLDNDPISDDVYARVTFLPVEARHVALGENGLNRADVITIVDCFVKNGKVLVPL